MSQFIVKNTDNANDRRVEIPVFDESYLPWDGTVTDIKVHWYVNGTGLKVSSIADITKVRAGIASIQLSKAESDAFAVSDKQTFFIEEDTGLLYAPVFVQVFAEAPTAAPQAIPTAVENAAANRDDALDLVGNMIIAAGSWTLKDSNGADYVITATRAAQNPIASTTNPA